MLIFDNQQFLTYQNEVLADAHVHPFLVVPTWYEDQVDMICYHYIQKLILTLTRVIMRFRF